MRTLLLGVVIGLCLGSAAPVIAQMSTFGAIETLNVKRLLELVCLKVEGLEVRTPGAEKVGSCKGFQ